MDAGFSVEAATQAYLATVSGATRARSDAYFEGGYWLLLWGTLVHAGIALVLLRSGMAAGIAAWGARTAGRRTALGLLLGIVPIVALLIGLGLPWDFYTGFVREHQYGMSNLKWGAWLGEWLIGAAIGTAAMSLLAWGVLAAIRRFPKSWWAWGTALTVSGIAVMIAAGPVFIDPLFNDYKPMAAGPLRDQILSMARANGVAVDQVYVVDASRQTKRISANVAGLGGTMRVALNDNLLNQCTPAEVRAVMGHELGHYVLGHIPWTIAALGGLVLLAFVAVDRATPWLLRRYGRNWGVTSLGDPAALPAVVLVLTVFALLAQPVLNTIIRVNEQAADAFGINAARAPDGFASVAMKLAAYRKLEPGVWEERLMYDHPSGRTRVETAMRWKAEHLGEPGVE